MSRLPDWQSRLYNALRDKQTAPFAWGENDCLLFAADIVLAMTGTDYADGMRGTYSTAREAMAVLHGLSQGGDIIGALDKRFRRVPLLHAMRGDLVAMTTEHGPAVGVCAGGGCFFVCPTGLFSYPLQSCITAWRVT